MNVADQENPRKSWASDGSFYQLRQHSNSGKLPQVWTYRECSGTFESATDATELALTRLRWNLRGLMERITQTQPPAAGCNRCGQMSVIACRYNTQSFRSPNIGLYGHGSNRHSDKVNDDPSIWYKNSLWGYIVIRRSYVYFSKYQEPASLITGSTVQHD